jgi:hypothetical protein
MNLTFRAAMGAAFAGLWIPFSFADSTSHPSVNLAISYQRNAAEEAPKVRIHGQIDLVALSGFGSQGHFGITTDGRPLGAQGSPVTINPVIRPAIDLSASRPTSAMESILLFNEASVALGGEAGKFSWRSNAVATNMVTDGGPLGPNGFQSQSTFTSHDPFANARESLYLQYLGVKTQGEGKMPYRIELGRFDHRADPYLFQRPDNTQYYANERWDDGAWSMDGAQLRLGHGEREFNLFFGRTDRNDTTNGVEIQPMTAGSPLLPFSLGTSSPIGQIGGGLIPIDHVVGADIRWPLLKTGVLTGGFVETKGAPTHVQPLSTAPFVNRVRSFGGTYRFTFMGFPIHGSYYKSQILDGGTRISDGAGNEAMDFGINASKGLFGLKAGYRSIGPRFGAPGDWGHIGMWWNPTDINELYFKPRFNFLPGWTLTTDVHAVSGQGRLEPVAFFAARQIPLPRPMGKGDHDLNVSIGIEHDLPGGAQGVVAVEQSNWDLKNKVGGNSSTFAGGEPTERFYDFGLSWGKDKTTFSVLLQISDYNSAGTQGFQPFPGNPSILSAHGGLLTTQLTTKF